jgi:hypothetical protein
MQYRDLPEDAWLGLNVFELREGRPLTLVGSTAMPMFNKKGRLKTGHHALHLHEGEG